MVKIDGPKATFVSQVRIRSELSDNHSGMTYLTFSECVHDAIPSGDLALQINSSYTRTDLQSKVARRDYAMTTIRNVIQLDYSYSSDPTQSWTQMSILDNRL